MPTLSSSIVKHNVASVRDVEEALARQAMYGGDLVTNLLELSSISETDIAKLLAESHEVAAAPGGELPASAPDVLRLVPKDLARRFGLYPLERREDLLVVAVSEPLPSEVESDLTFSLGLRVEQRVGLTVRIQQALARDYGLAMDQRAERILAKLAGRPDPRPSVTPDRGEPEQAQEPDETSGAAALSTRMASDQPLTAAPATQASAPDRSQAPLPPPQELPEPPVVARARIPRENVDLSALARPRKEQRARRLGPYTPAMAERDLLEAEDSEDVLRALFDFASQYFEYTALFDVHGDLAEGRDAAGSGAPRARVLSLGIPLDLPSSLSRAAQAERFSLVRLGAGGLDGAFARDLDRRPGPQVLMMPIRVRKRTVLVLYGDHGHQDVQLDSIGQLISFAPLVSSALEHLILKRKQAGGTSLQPRVRAKHAPLPRPKERAAALASALGVSPSQPPGAPSQPPGALSRPPPSQLPTRPSSEPPVEQPRSEPPASQPRLAAEAPPITSPFASPGPLPVEARRTPTPEPTSAKQGLMRPVISIGELSRSKTPAQGTPSTDTRDVASRSPFENVEPPEEGWDVGFGSAETGTRPGVGSARKLELVADSDRLSDPPAASPEAPDVSVGAASLEDELDMPPDSGGVPLAPASRSLAHSARPLPIPKGSEELRLPTVIVDLANDCQALLEQLLAGSHAAGDKLVQIGEPAVTVLASSFPGPITAELRRGVGNAPSRASECGPVLRTLARIGVKAAPVLVVRTADADPNVRAWATRLLGEMPSEESARAVVRRFIDEDQEVRRAALAAGRLMQSDVNVRSLIQGGLQELLADPARPEEQRHALIEAIADLRDGHAVPTVIRLLGDRSSDVVRSARWALVVLTRQDYGASMAAWEEWWRRNGSRHRIEWLIDALLHETAEIRRAAGDELKSTTKEYFGYYDDLPMSERQRAQNKYREWWENKGKARFR